MSTNKIPGVEYPREVPCPAGMPEGWFGVEKAYGEASAYYGKTYVRFSSRNGKHKFVISPKASIEKHCQDTGEDFHELLEHYDQAQRDRKQAEAEARTKEKEEKGIVKGAARETAIESFRAEHGELVGNIVYCFKGWKTRWLYQPNCGQVMITYTDTEGQEWKLLKDLECYLWTKMQQGRSEEIGQMIADAKLIADPARFGEGSRSARATQGTVEIEGGLLDEAEMKTGSREEFGVAKKQKVEHTTKGPLDPDMKAAYKRCEAVKRLDPAGPTQTDWAALKSMEEVNTAFGEFRKMLTARSFSEDTALVAMHGLSEERHFHRRIHGVYYQLTEPVNDRPIYQKLLHLPLCNPAVGCDGLYIMWNPPTSQWQVTTFPEPGSPHIARCAGSDAETDVTKVAVTWEIANAEGSFFEVEELKVVVAPSE